MKSSRRAEIEALVDTSPNQVGWLREAARELLAEVDRLEGEVIAAESVMEIERGAAHKAEAQIAAAEAKLAKAKADMQWFIERCERGEIRSTETLSRFRSTLSEIEDS